MVQIWNLHKSYGETEVLKAIDLIVRRGEVVTIIGPSGSGKSTLLSCINFLEPFEQGKGIRARPGKTRDDAIFGHATNLDGVGFHHRIAERHLAVATHRDKAVVADSQDRRRADFHHRLVREAIDANGAVKFTNPRDQRRGAERNPATASE